MATDRQVPTTPCSACPTARARPLVTNAHAPRSLQRARRIVPDPDYAHPEREYFCSELVAVAFMVRTARAQPDGRAGAATAAALTPARRSLACCLPPQS
jgi:hypothetical protein